MWGILTKGVALGREINLRIIPIFGSHAIDVCRGERLFALLGLRYIASILKNGIRITIRNFKTDSYPY